MVCCFLALFNIRCFRRCDFLLDVIFLGVVCCELHDASAGSMNFCCGDCCLFAVGGGKRDLVQSLVVDSWVVGKDWLGGWYG